MSIATMAPVAAIFFNTIPASGVAGITMPLSFLLSLVAMLLIANAVTAFSREISSAGSFYAYVSHGLGTSAGFFMGWVFILFYAIVAPFIFSIFGVTVATVVQANFGVAIPWPVFYLLGAAVVFALSYFGIRQSLNVDLTFLFYEIGIVVLLALTIVFKMGGHFFTVQPFIPSNAPHGFSGVFFGMIFGILSFIGFEAAATLGEETRDPKRAIPRAVFGAVLLIGIFYVVMAYVATVGYGLGNIAKFATDANPFHTIATNFWGPHLSVFVDLAGIIGLFACALAGNNAAIRVLYSMGRDGFIWKRMGETHHHLLTPTNAIYVSSAFTLIIGLGLSAWLGPINAYGFLGILAVLVAVVAYALVNLALIVFMLKQRRQHFRVLPHLVVPILGIMILILPVYGVLVPFPPFPFDIPLFIAIVWSIIGLLALWYLKGKRPDAIAKAGRTMVTTESE